MTRYQVVHETLYRYESPVVLSQQLLHLRPRTLARQRLEEHHIAIEPEPAETTGREDYFGNPVTQFLLAAPHSTLAVRAESRVEVCPSPQLGISPTWEEVRDALRQPQGEGIEANQFLFESPHVEFFRELEAYAARYFARGRPVFEAVRELTRQIHADFKFDPKATSVSTPLREVLAKRRGVCQDFAHFMAGCLRMLGLPARYVSGYILTSPPPARPRLVGADASHAWVAAWCGPAGWVEFDPTNDCVVDDAHVSLAWGRDFGDVTPMRGVILGGGEQELEVRVTVTPQ